MALSKLKSAIITCKITEDQLCARERKLDMFIIHTCNRTERVNIRIKYATKVFRDATKHLERYNMLRTPTSTLLRGA